MGCGCRKTAASAARATAPSGYKVTFPDGTTQVFLTDIEARRAIRLAGGGSARMCTGDCAA